LLEWDRAPTLRDMTAGLPPRPGLAARALAGLLVLSLALAGGAGCGGSGSDASGAHQFDPNVARYRLLLRENPVDPGQAFRCYGACQEHTKPDGYLGCLTQCPAFEVTEGIACEPYEVPPIAACITARKLPRKDELSPGYVVVAVLANVALIVALGAACSAATSCGAAYYYYPGPLPPQ
jgi:hypothetical protein